MQLIKEISANEMIGEFLKAELHSSRFRAGSLRALTMLGYNEETAVENATWSQQVRNVVDAYPAVKFYFVGEASNMYEAWLEPANTQAMTHRQFIGYCDV